LKLIKPGSTVILKDNIEAIVLAVQIGPIDVLYECSWWAERERKMEWINECEIISLKKGTKLRVGFRDEH